MGLDTYAARSPGEPSLAEADERAFDEAAIELCGGMLSGEGGSFRGKVYEEVVLEVTGVSLYQEWIPPEVVWEMADALGRCDPEVVAAATVGGYHATTAFEVRELARFFRICADRHLGLAGSW